MACEVNAKHVVDFPLIPVGSGPKDGQAIYFKFADADRYLDTNPMVILQRKEMIDDLKAWRSLPIIDCCKVHEVAILELGILLQKTGQCEESGFGDSGRVLSQQGMGLNDVFREPVLQTSQRNAFFHAPVQFTSNGRSGNRRLSDFLPLILDFLL